MDEGAKQHPVVVVAAGIGVLVGVGIPIIGSGAHASDATPYALLGCLFGLAVGFLLLRLTRSSIGTPLMVVALLVALFVFQRLGGAWPLAIPAYVLSSFAGAIFGSHLRFTTSRRRRRQAG